MKFKRRRKNIFIPIVMGAMVIGQIAMSSAEASSLKSVAKNLAKGLSDFKSKRIAVLPFPYHDGGTSSGSSIVSEHLTMLLVGRKGIEVVERTLLDKMLSEMKLENTGVTDAASSQKIGQVLGVDAIVTGTLIDLEGGETEVNARLIRTETGEILAAATTRVDRTWKDLPRHPETAETSPAADDGESHLHMSALIPTHPAHRRMPPPPPLMVASAGPADESSLAPRNGEEVLTLTNADLVPVAYNGETRPEPLIDGFMNNPNPPSDALSIAKRIYHRNPDERIRAKALLTMGILLEREGRPGWAHYAFNQLIQEFPNQPDLQDQARSHLAARVSSR